MGCNICECRHLIIVLSAAKVGCGRGGWGLLRWMLLTTITTEAQFRSWCGVHCMCNGFLLQSLWESTHVQAAHTLHGGSYSKSRGLICMIYMLHLRSPPPSPPHPFPSHICDSESNYLPLATLLIPHTFPITIATFPAFRKREIRRVPRNLSQERGRVQTDSAANLKNVFALSGWEGAEI